MFNPKKRILAWLLHNANADPLFIYKREFYKIKDTILQKHGIRTELYDLQHIQKECWTCKGADSSSHPLEWGACMNCGGTRLYFDFWVILDIWILGKYEFHKPVLKLHRVSISELRLKYQISSQRKVIDDYITHRPKVWCSDCGLILFLLYAPKLFWRAFGKVGFGRKTPVSFLFDCAFKLRTFCRNFITRGSDEIPF